MTAHPPLEWMWVQSWALANKVPDHAVLMLDDDGREWTVTGWAEPGILAATLSPDPLPVTWGEVKDAPPGPERLLQVLRADHEERLVFDLGAWQEEPGEDYLILQTRWG